MEFRNEMNEMKFEILNECHFVVKLYTDENLASQVSSSQICLVSPRPGDFLGVQENEALQDASVMIFQKERLQRNKVQSQTVDLSLFIKAR